MKQSETISVTVTVTWVSSPLTESVVVSKLSFWEPTNLTELNFSSPRLAEVQAAEQVNIIWTASLAALHCSSTIQRTLAQACTGHICLHLA